MHSLSFIQRLFTNYILSEKTRTVYLLDGKSKCGDHSWNIYSMAGAIGATAWQKGFICRYHYLCCHSQWKSLVTWTDLSNSHIDEGYCMS